MTENKQDLFNFIIPKLSDEAEDIIYSNSINEDKVFIDRDSLNIHKTLDKNGKYRLYLIDMGDDTCRKAYLNGENGNLIVSNTYVKTNRDIEIKKYYNMSVLTIEQIFFLLAKLSEKE